MTKDETIVLGMAIGVAIIAFIARGSDLGLEVTIALAIIVLIGSFIVVVLDSAVAQEPSKDGVIAKEPSKYTPEDYDTFKIHKIIFLLVILSCAASVLVLIFS